MPWPKKTFWAIVWFGAMMFALTFVPQFEQFHTLRLQTVASVFDFVPAAVAASGDDEAGRALGNLIDRRHALDAFFRALANADAGHGVVNVLHFGDSPITADQISGEVRNRLHRRFGDAGHGFVLVAKPWPWYHHDGIELSGRGWKINAASVNPASDRRHGLGGVSFSGGRGASSSFRIENPAARVEVDYWSAPDGGEFELTAEGDTIARISTAKPTAGSRFLTVALPAEARRVGLRVLSGRVRLFGLSFETDGPGVRYHSLGLNGGQVTTLLSNSDEAHWTEQVRHYQPDLIIVNYGTNESGSNAYVHSSYASDLRALLAMVRRAAPAASILVMSPMDRGERGGTGQIATVPTLPALIEVQRGVAAETGCAFFNTFQAMGGAGTMARWYETRPRLVSADFIHPLPGGARRVGILVEEALYGAYRQSLRSH